MAELSKFFQDSYIDEVRRSEIHFHPRNPRRITEEGKKALKRSMKNFGILGGIVINKRHDNVLISGHQKVALMDEKQKYDPADPETDYILRVLVVDFDEKRELEALTALNSRQVGGEFDWQLLAEIVPDVDYKNAGLTEEDLSMIGCDYLFQTEDENALSDDIKDLMSPVEEQHQAEVAQRKAQREAIKQAQVEANAQQDADIERQQKIQHMKDVKEQVKTQAIERALDQEAYVMISFDNFKAKQEFLQQAGYPDDLKFIKGEDFINRIEFVE